MTVLVNPRATFAFLKSFSTNDFRDDIKKITVPTLILHGGRG